MKIRHIEGLRALAALFVLVYHLKVFAPNAGFLGVDMFLVISGFLIGRQLNSDIANNSVSVFMAKRVLRIVPLLSIVSIITLFGSYLILLPDDFKQLGGALFSGAWFGYNFFFWRLGDGYFNSNVELIPVLHYWSIALEMQFYVIAVISWLFVKRYKKSWQIAALVSISIASFGLANLGTFWGSGQAAFFLLPTRLWEFGMGFVLSVLSIANATHPNFRNRMLQYSAFILLIASVIFINKDLPNPSIWNLGVVISTALLIILSPNTTILSKVLSSGIFVHLGKISYGIYLIHFPVITFAVYMYGKLNFLMAVIITCVVLISAHVTYLLIEKPFKYNGHLTSVKVMLAFLGLSASSFFGYHTVTNEGFQGRYNTHIINILEKNSEEKICASGLRGVIAPEKSCIVGDRDNIIGAFVGDSHANQLAIAADEALRQNNVGFRVLTFAGCPPLTDVIRKKPYVNCGEYFREVLSFLDANSNLKYVVYSARFGFYLSGTRYNNQKGGVEPGAPPKYAIGNNDIVNRDWKDVFLTSTFITIDALRKNDRRLILVNPVPEIGWDVPKRVARALVFDLIELPVMVDATHYKLRNGRIIQLFEDLANADNIMNVKTDSFLCSDDVQKCFASNQGRPYYQDDDHLNDLGASPIIDNVLRMVLHTK